MSILTQKQHRSLQYLKSPHDLHALLDRKVRFRKRYCKYRTILLIVDLILAPVVLFLLQAASPSLPGPLLHPLHDHTMLVQHSAILQHAVNTISGGSTTHILAITARNTPVKVGSAVRNAILASLFIGGLLVGLVRRSPPLVLISPMLLGLLCATPGARQLWDEWQTPSPQHDTHARKNFVSHKIETGPGPKLLAASRLDIRALHHHLTPAQQTTLAADLLWVAKHPKQAYLPGTSSFPVPMPILSWLEYRMSIPLPAKDWSVLAKSVRPQYLHSVRPYREVEGYLEWIYAVFLITVVINFPLIIARRRNLRKASSLLEATE